MGGVSRQQFDPEMGDFPITGRKALSRIDVVDRIAPHFADRVMEAVIGRMEAADIRGETGLQDKIQADMMQEAERICGDIGIMVRAVSVQWALNAVEREEFEVHVHLHDRGPVVLVYTYHRNEIGYFRYWQGGSRFLRYGHLWNSIA